MRAFAILALSALAGCTVGTNYTRPTIPLTPRFTAADAITVPDADWWRGFGDPVLTQLIAEALAGNTDLAGAVARIDQSRALARAAGAALLPSVDGDASATTVSQSLQTPVGRVTTALGVPRGYSQTDAGIAASWEIDLFGRLRRGREAARADLAASRADADAMRVAVAAETADAYLALRMLQARLAVAEGQSANTAQLETLVHKRFDQGIATERELNRAVAEHDNVAATMAPLRAGIVAALNRIDVLTGVQAGTHRERLTTAAAIPAAPAPAGSTVPSDLLRVRPDVVAAERRLAASHARIGEAIGDYYPRISLSGLLGVASVTTAPLFAGNAVQASGTAGLRWRLFNFGRVAAEVAQARGREAEALAAWRGAVLGAAGDVETTLARLGELHAQRMVLEHQVTALRTARRQAQDAYAGGVLGLIDVTDADRQLLVASDQLAAVRGDEARGAVAAYRALGGGWHPAPVLASRAADHM